jgi:hypothetical protein
MKTLLNHMPFLHNTMNYIICNAIIVHGICNCIGLSQVDLSDNDYERLLLEFEVKS